MIPAYHCNDFLPRCLASVLNQGVAPDEMQIVVVNDDPADHECAKVIQTHGQGRVGYHHNERNLGAGGAYNRGIELAVGRLVFILHGDDFVLPGFFAALGALADANPSAGLVACRAIGVDEHDNRLWDSLRYPAFETFTRDDSPIWEQLHLMPSAVVIRREVYSRLGGFRTDIANGQDWEMWSRVIRNSGIIMTPEILSAYRQHSDSITGRTKRTAQIIRDFATLYRHFATIHPDYPLDEMLRGLRGMAHSQALQYRALGDHEAETANMRAWAEITSPHLRAWAHLKEFAKRIIRSRQCPVT